MKKQKSCLRIYRKRSGLSQRELAALLGYQSPAVISRLENGLCPPRLWQFLALEIIFSKTPAEIFPPLFVHIEDVVMRRAYEMHQRLSQDPSSQKLQAKLAMLDEIKERATRRVELRK